MTNQLDETDARILDLLQQDGRILFKDLARLARVSVPTVRYRMRRLLEKGIIRKFSAIIDPAVFGRVKAIFSISGKSSDLEDIGRKLGDIEEVREVCITTGLPGIVVRAEVWNLRELVELAKKIARIPEITTVALSIVTSTMKNETVIRVPPGTQLNHV